MEDEMDKTSNTCIGE